jgi:hypothetical protein
MEFFGETWQSRRIQINNSYCKWILWLFTLIFLAVYLISMIILATVIPSNIGCRSSTCSYLETCLSNVYTVIINNTPLCNQTFNFNVSLINNTICYPYSHFNRGYCIEMSCNNYNKLFIVCCVATLGFIFSGILVAISCRKYFDHDYMVINWPRKQRIRLKGQKSRKRGTSKKRTEVTKKRKKDFLRGWWGFFFY